MSLKLNYLFRSKRRHRPESGNAVPLKGPPYRAVVLLDNLDAYDEAVFEESVLADLGPLNEELERAIDEWRRAKQAEVLIPFSLRNTRSIQDSRPPFNAEYLLYLFLDKDERNCVIGDLIESYNQVVARFNKRRGDIWFCKQVAFSLFPLIRRAVLKIGALVWLGRVLRRLIS